MRELDYPFSASDILKKKKQLRRALLADGSKRLKKRVAVLGGSTTHDILLVLELFLLNDGIEPEFYECGYGKYWEDVMFDEPELVAFRPDFVYLHTTLRNIPDNAFPALTDTPEQAAEKENICIEHFTVLWDKLLSDYDCEIIQDNFELPSYRLLGNLDGTDPRGRTHFVRRLNERFAAYAREQGRFHVNDAAWLSADYGLGRWSSSAYWNMYKYCPAVPAIPYLAKSVESIIKACCGKNKKALVLDLDNTLWGGVVGDDGPENIEIGMENGLAEQYTDIQKYIRAQKDIGVLLTIDSKNDEANALAGLSRTDSVLKPDDFLLIKANWEPKDQNALAIASELNIGADALVFVDDNPAERHMVREQIPGCAVPEMTEGQSPEPENTIRILDRSAFFEPVHLSADDLKRSRMYRENLQRAQASAAFQDYGEYLQSLSMRAVIEPFAPMVTARIAQLTNKSNQFNLTTARFTQSEIEAFAADSRCVTLYGRLSDRFGDNGVVSVIAGMICDEKPYEETVRDPDAALPAEGGGKSLDLFLWLMSCRVLKRGMERAMLDELVRICQEKGISALIGHYYPTAKNRMVRDFYAEMGFALTGEDAAGNRNYALKLSGYVPQNQYISVNPQPSGE